MGGDVRAARCVAHVFRKFFFPAVWIGEAGFDGDSRHDYDHCNLSVLCQATGTRFQVIAIVTT